MSKFSASDAAFSGFRLVRENLKTVAIWAVGMTVLSLISNVLAIQFFGVQMQAVVTYLSDTTTPDPEVFASHLSNLAPMMLWTLPYSFIMNGVIFAALNRLVLRHDDSKTAYVRLGAQELRQASVWFLMVLSVMSVLFFGSALAGFLGGLGGAMGAFLALLTVLGSIGGAVYLAVRLSFASPVTFDTGRFTLFRSLPETKGLFWPLFGAYLLGVVMSLIVVLLLMMIVYAIGLIASGDLAATGKMMRSDSSSLQAYFTPAGVVRTLFAGLISVLTTMIVFSPAPAIYRELKDRRTGAETTGGW